jgi:hypothetical protein
VGDGPSVDVAATGVPVLAGLGDGVTVDPAGVLVVETVVASRTGEASGAMPAGVAVDNGTADCCGRESSERSAPSCAAARITSGSSGCRRFASGSLE